MNEDRGSRNGAGSGGPNVLLIGAAGYIGSRLAVDLPRQGFSVVGCDLLDSITPEQFAAYHKMHYLQLEEPVIAQCDAVLWFAGHSSVKISESDPFGALRNNIFDLAELFRRVGKLGKPIIYASSASVLSSSEDQYSHVANEVSANSYDASKLAFDIITPHLGVHCLGLRMATVSGWSPNMRWDLLFNAMNASASKKGVVRVQNSSSFRSILFIDDLCSYVSDKLRSYLGAPLVPFTSQVGLGSWSGTIGTLGAEISDFWSVPLEFGLSSGTYSFVLSDRELSRSRALDSAIYISIRRRCALFAEQSGWKVGK